MASNRNMSSRGSASTDDDKQRYIARKGRERALDDEAQVFQGPRPRDGSWPQGGQSVLDEKQSFARHLKIASDAGRKVSRSSGGTFANDHAVGKLRILRTLSGNRNGLESHPVCTLLLTLEEVRLTKECIQHCGSSRVLWFKSTSNRRCESARLRAEPICSRRITVN